MKLTMVLLFLGLVSFGNSFSQTTLTFQLNKAGIRETMQTIESKSNCVFLYKDEIFDFSQRISVNFNETTVEDVIKTFCELTGVDYEILNGQVLLKEKAGESAGLPNITTQATKKKVTGKVTDNNGAPMPGASVVVKGTTIGITTDADGNFSFEIPGGAKVLVVSFIGMKPQEIEIGSKTTFDVSLEVEHRGIEEVVVVGYGKQKRSGVVSSINTVTAKEIQMPTGNLTNNLAGQMAGLIAIQRSGEPGYDSSEFWIRGVSTFKGGTNPLIIVDGVPRSMSDIEPDEIDTFTLLKDAAATAVYGAEGANGVILITTKRGRIERPKISFRAERTTLTPTRMPSFLGSVEFMNAYNEALWNEGMPDLWTQDQIALYDKKNPNWDSDLYPNVNWLDLLNENTNSSRFTMNFQGGTESARYFVGTSYYHESGIFEENTLADYKNNIGMDRFGLRSNIDLDVSKTTLLALDVNTTYGEYNYPGAGNTTGNSDNDNIFNRMTTAPPNLYPMVYSDGTLAGHPDGKGGNRLNPYNLIMNTGYQKEWRINLQTKIALTQQLKFITNGLSAKVNVAFDANAVFNTSRVKNPVEYNATGRDANGKLIFKNVNSSGSDNLVQSDTYRSTKNIYIDGSINYSRTFAEKHDVNAMFLYMQKDLQQYNNSLPFRKQGLIGRVTYSYDERYNFEGNFGYTGSENFAAGQRFGFFPAVGASWYVSNENFYAGKIKDIISKLRFRVSYGITGNDNTGSDRFLFRGTLNTSAGGYNSGWGDTGALGGVGSGIRQNRFDAPYLTWETETKRNYGLDFGLFKSKFDLSVDYFDNFREGILLQRQTVSNVTGFAQMPWQNYGKVKNRGFDASALYKQMLGNVRIGFRANATYARNKILEMDEVPQAYDWMKQTGRRIGEKYLYQADGFYRYEDFNITGSGAGRQYTLKEDVVRSSFNANVRPGDIKYKDLNGDGVISIYDQAYGGAPSNPEFVYGFGVDFEYKNFYGGVFFQGADGTSAILGGNQPAGFHPFQWNRTESTLRTIALDRWTDRDAAGNMVDPDWNALYPRLSTTADAHNTLPSTHWMRDASFIRFKNAQVGYNFSKEMLKKFNLTSARVYCMATNIAVWDKIKFWDPEVGNTQEGMSYPLTMNISFGFEVVF